MILVIYIVLQILKIIILFCILCSLRQRLVMILILCFVVIFFSICVMSYLLKLQHQFNILYNLKYATLIQNI